MSRLVWFFGLIFLGGCSQKIPNKNTRKIKKELPNSFLTKASQKEAKLSDIPIPLQMKPSQIKNELECTKDIILAYTGHMTLEDLVIYYQWEMERLGWNQIASFSGNELLLTFDKPNRMCALSIRQLPKNQTELVIFSKDK